MVTITELGEKEVINIRDGTKLGIIDDVDIDLENGEVKAIIISGPGKILGIFGKNQDVEIKWRNIIKIGIDTILVDYKTEE